jgi:nucleoid-associated protein YgaU
LKKGMEIKVPVSSSTAKPTQASIGGMGPTAPSNSTPTTGTTGRVYTVKSGDTLMSIAGHELGSSKKWSEIAKANEDVLHGSTALKVGMKLQIPGDAGGSATVASRDPAPSAGAAATGVREYVVKSGDTLWSIAKSEMGGESFLKDLRAANQDVLRGSDSLKIGMKLTIPGKK